MKLLVIDDEVDMCDLIVSVANDMGINCITATKVDDFIAALNEDINIIILDLLMPDIDGIELLRLLAQRQCKSKIILMSGVDKRTLQGAQEVAISLGLPVIAALQKPFKLTDLAKAILIDENLDIAELDYLKVSNNLQQTTIDIDKDELQLGIDRKEFVVHYQPQIEIATNKMVGLEALVRWQHPKHGLIFPDAFIGHAEAMGLITHLGWYVLEKSINEITQFKDRFATLPGVSVNVSPYSLQDLQFPDKIIALVKVNNFDPANVTLEITESGFLEKLSSALDILTRLRMKKFRLSIDDFGTGFSMMRQLQNVPATELKVDKSLVQDIKKDSTCIMIKKIIEMGHDLGMRIVAEGVETEEQLNFLRINNCDVIQGYLYSKPKPLAELTKWFDNK